MIFDKINFIISLLSSSTVVSGQQNLLKLFVADTIGNTNINKVEYRITSQIGRESATIIIDWEEMAQDDTFYTSNFTPTFTGTPQLLLSVRITDYIGNTYLLSATLTGGS